MPIDNHDRPIRVPFRSDGFADNHAYLKNEPWRRSGEAKTRRASRKNDC